MRAVIFSDVHLHNYNQFSKIDEETGLNTRLIDGINVLEQIRLYCVENDIKLCIFGGDMFHRGSLLSPDIISLFIKEVYWFNQSDITIVGIPGQHDYLYKDGRYNALSAFINFVYVLDRGKYAISNEINIIPALNMSTLQAQLEVINYSRSIREKGKINVLLGHFLVKEVVPNVVQNMLVNIVLLLYMTMELLTIKEK